MAIPETKNIRGLQNIVTRSGIADQMSEPYRAFLRIGALEMEKARRAKERESAALKIEAIDARFREIDAEKTELLKILDLRNINRTDASGKKNTPGSNHNHSPGGFKLSY